MKMLFTAVLLLLLVKAQAQNKAVDSLKNLIRHSAADTSRVNLLNQLPQWYTWSVPDSSLMYAQQALRLAQKINYTNGMAESEAHMCLAYAILGNYSIGLKYGFRSLAFFKKTGDDKGTRYAMGVIAYCYREQGDYKSSLKYFRLDLYNKHFASQSSVTLYGNLSTVYEKDNQLDSALYYAQKAYSLNKNWSGVTVVLGNIYTKRAINDSALHFFRITAPLAQKENAQTDIMDAYNGIARVYMNEGNADSVIHYAKKSLTLNLGKIYPAGVLGAISMLSSIYEKKHMADSAFKYLKLTIAINNQLFSRQKEREVQNIAFSEQLNQQELLKQQEQNRNQNRTYALIAVLIIILCIAALQWRNNRHRQKAYNILQQQKQEIDTQKAKVEQTLGELRATETQLIHAEKMASLGELTAGIAHEIQNPLNFVNNFAEVNREILEELKEELQAGRITEALSIAGEVQQNEERIQHHGKRADSIVKDMLRHSRTSNGQKDATDINKLADEYLRLAYHGLRAKDKSFNAELTTHFDEGLPQVNIAAQDVGRALLNLFNNAFYAVQQQAKTAGPDYKPAVEVSTALRNADLEITVTDNGTGIPEKIQEKILQPFFTTKPTGEGTGLGLSLTYDIVVKGHNGKIDIKSQPGRGTSFIISLPV